MVSRKSAQIARVEKRKIVDTLLWGDDGLFDGFFLGKDHGNEKQNCQHSKTPTVTMQDLSSITNKGKQNDGFCP